MATKEIKLSVGLSPAEPLWKLAPTHDEDGIRIIDFMMIIPKLKSKPEEYIKNTLVEIERVLAAFSHIIVFANMDMKLNTLWVSVKPSPGITTKIFSALRLRVPEALLVGDAAARVHT